MKYCNEGEVLYLVIGVMSNFYLYHHYSSADLKQAIRDGDEESVRAALAGGLELNLLDGASGMTLLLMASAACQDGIVELLLRKRADVNTEQKNGVTALMHACEQVSK